MSAERYMVDDAGTLIDIVTRENYDTVEEVVTLLNSYEISNWGLQKDNKRLRKKIESLNENFNRLNKLFNEVDDVDEDLMMEYMKIVRRTIDE